MTQTFEEYALNELNRMNTNSLILKGIEAGIISLKEVMNKNPRFIQEIIKKQNGFFPIPVKDFKDELLVREMELKQISNILECVRLGIIDKEDVSINVERMLVEHKENKFIVGK